MDLIRLIRAIAERDFDALKQVDAAHAAAWRVPSLTGPLRLVSYALYRALEVALGERHPHTRVIAQARRLELRAAESERAFSSRGPFRKKVLFYTVRGWFIHVASEAILAKALQFRGAKAHFYLCGGGLPQCDFKPATDPHVTEPLCWRCTGLPTRLLAALGLSFDTTADLITPTVTNEATGLTEGRDLAALRKLEYRGLNLYECVEASVQRSLLRGDIPDDPRSTEIVRGYIYAAVIQANACERLLERFAPDRVVLSNGLFFAERIALDLACRRGIEVIAYERGMRPQTIVMARNKPVCWFDTDPYWTRASQQALEPDEERDLDRYLQERAGGYVGIQQLWPRMQNDVAQLRRQLRLPPRRPVLALFTNILWDTSLYRRDRAFAGMFDWLRATIAVFARNPRWQLLIRVHPAEVRLPMAASRDRVVDRLRSGWPVLPANVQVIGPEDPTSSYSLLEIADAVAVYASTIGLEAAVRGKPVVVAGRPHYSDKGFTTDVWSAESYAETLSGVLGGEDRPTARQRALARRYAYLFFFRYQLPFPWVVDFPRAQRSLRLGALARLAAGQDDVLDLICTAILEHGPYARF